MFQKRAVFGGFDSYIKQEFVIDVNESKKGIVPNMIHSRDGSHMMLTVLEMLKNGISDFAMIHDSFGCHAADAERMNDIIWDVFDRIYEKQREGFSNQIDEFLLEKGALP